jgi:hypothetical protein
MTARKEQPLKVFGWLAHLRHDGHFGQRRAIVAAPSFAAAQRLIDAAGLQKPTRDYCSVTANRCSKWAVLCHAAWRLCEHRPNQFLLLAQVRALRGQFHEHLIALARAPRSTGV